MKSIISRINQFFIAHKKRNHTPIFISQDIIVQTHNNAHKYYDDKDLVFLKEMGIYCAFKYTIVNELLLSGSFGVSQMHTSLNRIYFQTDTERHAHNKKTAKKYLDFLSKNLQFEDSAYLSAVFFKITTYIKEDVEFNLVDAIVNPVILINALNDLGFLEMFPKMNPAHPDFSYDYLIANAKNIFNNRSSLEQLIKENSTTENSSQLMAKLLKEFSVEGEVFPDELPFFFTTVIYTSIENVASFVSSFLYFSIKHYPEIYKRYDQEKLVALGNEVLRIYSPNFVTFRTATEDVKFKHIDIKKGEMVALFIGAANRDVTTFQEPLEIKLDRTEKHLAFSRGKISCIGQFASFRISLNFINCMLKLKGTFTILDDEPQFEVGGVVKIADIKTIYHVG
ncbi:MAG: hypothetical protein RL108_177 [Bacteroidota bacterium]|jgi:hypothetical protein